MKFLVGKSCFKVNWMKWFFHIIKFAFKNSKKKVLVFSRCSTDVIYRNPGVCLFKWDLKIKTKQTFHSFRFIRRPAFFSYIGFNILYTNNSIESRVPDTATKLRIRDFCLAQICQTSFCFTHNHMPLYDMKNQIFSLMGLKFNVI